MNEVKEVEFTDSLEAARLRASKQRSINIISNTLADRFRNIAKEANLLADDLSSRSARDPVTDEHAPYPNRRGTVAYLEYCVKHLVTDYHVLADLYFEIYYWDHDYERTFPRELSLNG